MLLFLKNIDLVYVYPDPQACGCTKQWKLLRKSIFSIKSTCGTLLVQHQIQSCVNKLLYTSTIHVKNRHLSLKIQSKDINHIFVNTKG